MHVKLLYSLVARACLTKTSTTPQCCFSFQYTVPYELVFTVLYIHFERKVHILLSIVLLSKLQKIHSRETSFTYSLAKITPWNKIAFFLSVTPSLYQLLPRRAFSSEAFWQKCRHVELGTHST
jgi:hypothetical protein